ncbi:DUF6093 family protein [Jonesia denitrificans]|uniref:Uncharacterized protein n=1 Tax=Jonesia denitrificans (strain ATCC 14870 / DSM 20603 / BCRC 15368 / CIP 55.134 / JCM 11481 / NBRC 15587 / NCTC 10816 / Prevot 55134) TaxID=471856 RepID=C7R1H3_JONDD|nr:DUF6093 family protein [Jonesia denitrificans]ACV09808.1 hypothetical protein Jden_2171 [Jonesia denitrificans DSM 20603]ASE08992.1 hypothetical protein CEP80_07480 [Jonesia denitrificans]QXB43538.1 hypothetical protein I6L70_01130 [Jonesia denitrificans]SQH22449.1 Uncharacterised protein [Jonesia denitrificans]
MGVSQAVRRSRASFKRKRLRARCVIEVVDASVEVTDPDTGEVTPGRVLLYEDVPCYARYPGLAFETDRQVGGVQIVDSRIVVRIPHEYKDEAGVWHPFVVPVNALITFTSDPDNPKMPGTTFLVKSLDDQSQATAQRILCEDQQRGPSV